MGDAPSARVRAGGHGRGVARAGHGWRRLGTQPDGGHPTRAAARLAQPERPAAFAAQELPADVAGALMSREHVLHKVRTALGRSAGQPVEEPPPVRLSIAETGIEARIESFCARIEALAGKTYRAKSPEDARGYVAGVLNGRSAVASNAAILRHCGITALAGVESGVTDRVRLRALCSSAACGITGANYALADTGTLVMLASVQEARMISLL